MKTSVCFLLILFLTMFAFGQTITFDFEDGSLEGWTQFPTGKWEVSASNPIGGTRSLKHAPTSGADIDRISVNLPVWDENEGTITCRFRLRHRFNPSGTNHWAVFLSSDVNAEGMISTGNPNGYAVGVNLTGTDDILRLYRVTNGFFTSILATSINWETQIGSTLSSIGAIEVERQKDGTFSVKVSTTGSFLNMNNEGSIIDTQHALGDFFGIYYRYTTTAAGLLMVDDISFTYKPINPNDPDALVLEPMQQVEGGIISSLATSENEAVDVFNFTIQDQGTTDGLPTHTTKLRFNRVESANAANWPQTIGGILLQGPSGPIPTEAVYIMSNAIEVEVDKNTMTVADGSLAEFTLSLYLKPEGIVDGATIQMKVDDENHGWEADFTGSAFAETFPAEVVSNVFTIQVIPTRLNFFSYPSQVVVNQTFSVIAHASDLAGNLATTFTGQEVELSLAEGAGILSPQENLMAISNEGVISWSNISYSAGDQFRLKAEYPDLQSATSGLISVINDPTSIVIQPTVQVGGNSISSTLTNPGQALEVFRFVIIDDGTNDQVPTYVRQLFIKRPTGTNLASFSGSIGGVVLKANGQIIPTGNPHILTASISIPIPMGALVIPDGESVEISLYIYLRTSGLADETNLVFMVDSNGHSFIADGEGSTFAPTFPQQVISNLFPINVSATRLNFSSVPSNVGVDSPFTIEISAVDAGGSLDINATGTVTLSKNSGEGWLTIPEPTKNLVGGKALWDDLMYHIAEPFTILASSSLYNDAVSPLIFCSDRTSTVLQTNNPLGDGLIPSTAVGTGDAVEVFRFRVRDPGTTDGLPTIITQLVFRSFGLPTDVSLSKAIKGLVLRQGDELIPISSTTITSNTITISLAIGTLVVPDGEELEVSLGVYLKEGGQIDGSTINLYIPASSHGWQTSSNGSGFLTVFEASVVGPVFIIDVNATSLTFVEQPFISDPDNAFELKVAATDLYGNVDKIVDGSATLSLDFGPGSYLVNSHSTQFQNGIAVWDDMYLNSQGRYRFNATTVFDETANAFTQDIWNGLGFTCMYNENFDAGYPESFPYSSHWDVSTVSPIDGVRSLKHNLSGVGGESSLPIPLNVQNMGSKPLEWSFVMRNGNWDPSSDNAFWFVLASDSTTIQLGSFNGYAVGVNLLGTSDLLTLWRVTMGQATQVLVQSTFDWDESETVGIRVTRTPNGEWALWYQPQFEQSNYILAGKSIDTRHTKVRSFGPVFKYTSTRAGELWIDNLKVCGVTYAPVIQSANLLNQTSIDIVFSSEVNQSDATNTEYYSLKLFEGQNFSILETILSPENPLKVSLRTEQLPVGSFLLKVDGVRSLEGTTTVRDSVMVGIGGAGTFGNVIINEIMARPSPIVGLPNVEYIELYNRTSSTISLNGWRIRGNNNYATISNASIEPNGYIILSGTSGAGVMGVYGNAVGVTSFPTLLVGGMFLSIYDNFNNLISWVEYSDTWYQNEIKKAGGYSLERIDPNNLVEGRLNWIASNDLSGGTPGRANSVLASNPDEINPKVTEVKVISPTQVEIGFSEPMDSLSITLVYNYTISKGIGNPVWATSSGPKYNRASLTFSSPLSRREVYDICFSNDITDFSGNSLLTNCLSIAVPENPAPNDVVINEVLFNPYTGGVDFVELFNRSDKPVDLKKMWIANLNRTTLVLNEFYPASDTAWILLPNSYAVLSQDPRLVEQFYYVENPKAMVWTRRMPAYANDNGYVLLLDEWGDVVDRFDYNERMHNKLISNVKGVSLERIHPNMPTNDPSSWQSAAQTSGFATPTARNSQYTEPTKGKDAFNLSHQVFSPDGDGFEDVLLINYELPESGYIANIMVFDSRGRRVKRLAANMPLGTSGSIKWDGTTDAGGRANMGAYVIFIEAFDLKGNVKRYKKTVVVATRLNR